MLRKKKTDGATPELADAVNENQDTIIVEPDEPESVDEIEKNHPDSTDHPNLPEESEESEESVESDDSNEPVRSGNTDKLAEAFEAWLTDAGLDAEGAEAAKEALGLVSDSISSGNFNDIFFNLITKGAAYDRAVEEAEIAGEVRGRNAKIDELRNAVTDDGLPHPGAGGGGSIPNRAPSIFDLARDAY